MLRNSRPMPHALVAAIAACLLPVFSFAAQQAPAPANLPAAATSPSQSAPEARRTPPDAATQEKNLGLKTPANPNLPTLFLVGDSTVRNGHGRGDNNQWGWGHPLHDYFDPAKINVVNRAIGGLSSHTYISQGHWANTLALVKPGDFVLIQFGHNDGGLNLPGAAPIPDQGLPPGQTPPPPPPGAHPRGPNARGSLPGTGDETIDVQDPFTHQMETVLTYGWYMRKYVEDVKAKGATPVICSLVPRKIWVDDHIVRNTSTYRGWAQQVAEQEHVGFVDLNEIIAERYDKLGPTAVDGLFGDPHTHTDMAGAILNAESVVAGLKALPGHPLDKYLNTKGEAIAPYKPQS